MKSIELMKAIEALYAQGISIVPSRNGKPIYPYDKWSQYREKEKRIPINELLKVFLDNDVDAQIICSNGVAGIDIDAKFKPDAAIQYFDKLKRYDPVLFEKIRITTSRSGVGRHILWICEEKFKSEDLASRPATDEELEANPKRKKYCFIEGKFDDAILVDLPTQGYELIQGEITLPILTPEEVKTLIAVAKSFDTMPKVEFKVSKRTFKADSYDENPFEHYAREVPAVDILLANGFTVYRDNPHHTYLTKPNSRSRGNDVTYIKESNVCYFWSTQTDFESQKGYNSAQLQCHYAHNNDWKSFYQEIANKYGKLTKQAEYSVIKRYVEKRALGEQVELPATISEQGRIQAEQEALKAQEQYPFGTFWDYDDKFKLQINRTLLYNVLTQLGYRLYNKEIFRIQNNIARYTDTHEIIRACKAYIAEELPETEITNAFDYYCEKHLKYTLSNLDIIRPHDCLLDTRDAIYKVFRNGVVVITKTGFELRPIDEFANKIMFESIVIDRHFNIDFKPDHRIGKFTEFIHKAVRKESIHTALMSMAWLGNNYKSEDRAYFIGFIEEVEDPIDGGGAGKSLISRLLNNVTTVHAMSADGKKQDVTYWQSWNNESVIVLSDIPERYKYTFLKDPIDGDLTYKKLFKDIITIPHKYAPKVTFNSNYGFLCEDGGVKRRARIIELTPYYTELGGVDKEFGGRFPTHPSQTNTVWNEYDWSEFYYTIFDYMSKLIKNDHRIESTSISLTAWAKSFKETYNEVLHNFIQDNIDEFQSAKQFYTVQIMNKYKTYCEEAGSRNYFSSTKVNRAIAEYCKAHAIECRNFRDAKGRGKEFGPENKEITPDWVNS